MIRRVLLLLVLFAVLGLVIVGLDAARFLTRPVANDKQVVVSVAPGTGFGSLARQLAAKGVFTAPRQVLYFIAYATALGETRRVRSGEYVVHAHTTPVVLLNELVAGKTRQHRLTIVEGWTFAQLRKAVAADTAIRHTLKGKDNAALMRAIGAAGEQAEGRFLPDTYLFPRGTTDVAFYRRCYHAMQDYLDKVWPQRAADLPLKSPYQSLILASIVEKETAVPAERARIAGVFVRRLRRHIPLQTDPTVIYGIADFDGNLRRSDLRRDTPYNTYTRRGLPPTPIALPGRASIKASLHPDKGDALYFVSRGDGTHHFSATLAEHDKAVRKYQLGK